MVQTIHIPRKTHTSDVEHDGSNQAKRVYIVGGGLTVDNPNIDIGDVGLVNVAGTDINPATEEKQDSIIAALGGSSTYALQFHVDSVDSNIAYKGEASIGTTTSASGWRIQRLDFSNGNVVKTWADGNDNFDNIYDNRESLSYS